MIVELINTGSELMLGRVLNTHQQWLCRRMSDLGAPVSRQVAVPDTAGSIQGAVRESLGRADLVVVTGGLGPTSDDITRDHIAALLNKSLREDPAIVQHLQEFFKSRGRRMPDRTRIQAQVPEGAVVLANAFGTAPGLAIKTAPNPFRAGGAASWLILLPGPPRELRPMFDQLVFPLLQREFGLPFKFTCRTLRATGMGESIVEEKIGSRLAALEPEGLVVGYCARPGQVDVRLSAEGQNAEALVDRAIAIVRERLGAVVYGEAEEELEAWVVRELTRLGKTLATAESCTGGLIANRITNVPGASAVFLSGWVAYSNAAKQTQLGVSPETLARHGAVSEAVARELAEGARRVSGADYALSVTGIAGPTGGTAEKPVGSVFIGLAGAGATVVEYYLNTWDRETFKHVTSQQALDLLRRKGLLHPEAQVRG
jgi:nicotinamide-nucleotide amidase